MVSPRAAGLCLRTPGLGGCGGGGGNHFAFLGSFESSPVQSWVLNLQEPRVCTGMGQPCQMLPGEQFLLLPKGLFKQGIGTYSLHLLEPLIPKSCAPFCPSATLPGLLGPVLLPFHIRPSTGQTLTPSPLCLSLWSFCRQAMCMCRGPSGPHGGWALLSLPPRFRVQSIWAFEFPQI